jgi:5-oxoprolinase (ATP-hydrolysing)
MQSHGGLSDAAAFEGKDSLLSGPAGGVVGMVAAARAAGFERVIGFDMGGTSTDVSLYDGALARRNDAVMAGVRVSAPMLEIETVAAGGGSILAYANGRLQVGPESAGAEPGPACYRMGGPPTVTDANVFLGRVQPEFFPRVFGANADERIDRGAAAAAFAALSQRVAVDSPGTTAEQVAAGCLRIAVERMANAIKRISVQRGHDTTRFALCSFGGAGGQHACQVADALAIGTVLVHPLAGVLSAFGCGLADLRELGRRTVEAALDAHGLAAADAALAALESDARRALHAQGVAANGVAIERRLHVKQSGSDTALAVPAQVLDENALRAAFDAAHERLFGFRAGDGSVALVVDSAEVEAVGKAAGAMAAPAGAAAAPPAAAPQERAPQAGPPARDAPRPASGALRRRVWFDGGFRDVPVVERERLAAGDVLDGPAVIVEANATTIVEDGWRATTDAGGCLVLTRARPRAVRETADTAADPVMLEIFNNLFMHVAEEMGLVLESTAHSVNIKERLDFSCALFDTDGGLIANAPHIPVHLGSMGDSVRRVLERYAGDLGVGDSFMLNSPYAGGTHLPDITVVTPVFGADGVLRYVVASRAHHADVGGTTPGSMPPASRRIEEEGVLLDAVRIVARGRFLEREAEQLFTSGPYPARNPRQNLADLKAQLAANARGLAALDKVVERFGLDVVHAYMRHVRANAEQCVRAAIARLEPGRFTVELDGGERIAVAGTLDAANGTATIDFTGTSAESAGNTNAPAAIVRAAVLYVFRTLVHERIPLNAGCLAPLTIVLPEPCLLNPRYPAAVVAGNVETSQAITDALLAALGACAAAQGTRNNFTFGNERYQYYETLCGGAGAGREFAGASAVHTHMTNSRLTDPEVLEWRYPVRVRRFAIRRGSGGAGAHAGGDGIIRDIEFLEPMRAAILSNRRRVPPFGLHGGAPGACGRNYVIRADGRAEELTATAEADVAPGDRFVIETPGGGGYGPPARSDEPPA